MRLPPLRLRLPSLSKQPHLFNSARPRGRALFFYAHKGPAFAGLNTDMEECNYGDFR